MDVSSLTQTSTTDNGSRADNALATFTEDFDQFLTLLTTQLQNQDPTNPMDSNEMTNQLVQFASVEQQIASNKNLEEMLNLLNASSDATAISYIDKEIQVEGDTTSYAGQPITFGYEPEFGAEELQVLVLDAGGRTVREFDGQTSAQRHTLTWDGTDENGDPVDPGTYQFVVSATDAESNTIRANTDVTGKVTGTVFTEDGPVLKIGDAEYTLSQVMSVNTGGTT